MRITKLQNGKRIITFGPHKSGNYTYYSSVYEQGNNRLIVDTVEKGGEKLYQNKTYTREGKTLKEIVVYFLNGIRRKKERIL